MGDAVALLHSCHRLARCAFVALCAAGAAIGPAMRSSAEPIEEVNVLPAEEWVAGTEGRVEVVLRIGPEGIPAGASVGLAFKHALNIRLSTAPSEAGYVEVRRSSGGVLPSQVVEWPPHGTFIYPKASGGAKSPPTDVSALSAVVRHSVFATVTDAPLAPGEEVRFILGAGAKGMLVPPNVCESPIRVVVDPEGDGTYLISERVPRFRIVSGPADHLFVTIPSSRRPGEDADICIRAEDKLNGLADTCSLDARLSGIPGLADTPVKLTSGLARLEVKAPGPGVWRVTAEANGMSCRSNPMVIRESPAWQVYWGDLHVHTVCSDGLGGDPDYAYAYARDAADLDVCALADHAPREPSRQATRRFNAPGRFVTLWGYEWAESEPGRLDRNIYFRSEDEPLPPGWPRRIEDFWKSLESTYGDNAGRNVIVGPHMFTYRTKALPWFKTWDERYERFAEIYSEHGMSEYQGNPRMLAEGKVQEGYFVQDGLAYGRKFGIIGSSDSHDSRPGRGSNSLSFRGGLVAFLARDLTRESIWDAFWNRRVYAATNDRIYVDLQIDGHAMGEAIVTNGPPRIMYEVYACEDEFEATLIRNNQTLRQTRSTDGEVREAFTDDSYDTDSFYYLRVVEAGGEHAWSSPIWVSRSR